MIITSIETFPLPGDTRNCCGYELTMIITSIETFPLPIPFKPGNRSVASAWGPKGLHAVDSLLVKVTTGQDWKGRANPSDSPGSRQHRGRSMR